MYFLLRLAAGSDGLWPAARTGLLGWGGWELELEALRIASMCHTTFFKDFSGCRMKNAELATMHLFFNLDFLEFTMLLRLPGN